MEKENFFGNIRKHLMTGVSYMIPFVVPGGILIAIGFAIGGIYVFNTPGFGADIFNWGKVAFGLMVPALAGYIAYSIADRPGIAVGFIAGMLANNQGSGFLGGIVGGLLAGYVVKAIKQLKVPSMIKSLMPVLVIPLVGTFVVGLGMTYILGGPVTWLNEAMLKFLDNLSTTGGVVLGLVQGAMLAFDMGGPINKAAYAFALAAAENNNWGPMAANFIASMSPPAGIALALVLFKNKWTKVEREGVGGCVVGGLAMITEFAIPYAAADPLHVLPSIMVGSAVGAALSYVFGLSLTAPHGGLFVIPLANKPFLWLVVFAIAIVVTAFMLFLLKPTVTEEEEEILSLQEEAEA
ncbi:MAG: PTS fructose transporter subunit IIC [Anaerolineaceae bacterium]|nr:PTS fructose transporter subunit IIC [Anaerolineaceae bacterium]